MFYEKAGLNMRLAGYYLTRNLWAIGSNTATDVFSDPRFSVDFGGTYALSKQVGIYLDAKNLTNTPLKFSEGTSNRTIQREFYGPTYQVGLNLNF